ncbi:MAG: hypothetical protein M0T84_05785 [Betaproteobacteria bacterium]|nr:hypothetical protein [Betaproteobacteria bacterium]
MTRLIWRLRQAARRVGAEGLTGLALCAAALILWRAGVVPAEHRLAVGTAEWRTLASRPAARRAPRTAGSAAWVAALPPASAIPAALGQLANLARAQGIELKEGHYGLAPVEGTGLSRWRARIPVKARYPALKRFLAASLAANPALTLDGFKLERPDADSRTLKAELRFSLYVRTGA